LLELKVARGAAIRAYNAENGSGSADVEEILAMKKQWVLVCVLAGALMGSNASAQHKAPNTQPSTTEAPPAATSGEATLGTVRLPKAVTADGKPLAAGSYTVKLTPQQAAPEAVGTTEALERWVELGQGKEVKGREVVSIVPQSEIKMVVKDTPPAPGTSKVQILRGNEYLRVWFNRGGTHYLIHFPLAAAAAPANK
jgi:hypothetical protein